MTLKPWLQHYPSFNNLSLYCDEGVAVVGLVVERLGMDPVLASFEVSVAIDDCASASFMFACRSCRVRSAIVFDMFATVLQSDCVAVARFAKAWLWSCVISANMAAFDEFDVFDCP